MAEHRRCESRTHFMQRFGEVWYFERSLAAPLTRLLSRRYAIRALPRPTRGHPAFPPVPGEAGIVCLADLTGHDLPLLRRLTRRDPNIRLIGVTRNGSDRVRTTGWFSSLARKATSKL